MSLHNSTIEVQTEVVQYLKRFIVSELAAKVTWHVKNTIIYLKLLKKFQLIIRVFNNIPEVQKNNETEVMVFQNFELDFFFANQIF